MSERKRPAPSANKRAWVAWAMHTGMDPDVAEDMTRAELVEVFTESEAPPTVKHDTVLEATRQEIAGLHPPAALAAAALALAKDLDQESGTQGRVLLARELRITMNQARALRSTEPVQQGAEGAAPVTKLDEIRAARERRQAGG